MSERGGSSFQLETDIDGLEDGTSQDMELEETHWVDDISHDIELEEGTDPVEDGVCHDFGLEEAME